MSIATALPPKPTLGGGEVDERGGRHRRADRGLQRLDLALKLVDQLQPLQQVQFLRVLGDLFQVAVLVDLDQDFHRHERAEVLFQPGVVVQNACRRPERVANVVQPGMFRLRARPPERTS